MHIMNCRKCGLELNVGDPFKEDDECDAEITNGVYGCDTGCEYVRISVTCPSCGDFFEEGSFGSFDNEEEMVEYLEEFFEEYIK